MFKQKNAKKYFYDGQMLTLREIATINALPIKTFSDRVTTGKKTIEEAIKMGGSNIKFINKSKRA